MTHTKVIQLNEIDIIIEITDKKRGFEEKL